MVLVPGQPRKANLFLGVAGLDVEAQPEAVKQNLIRAAAVGMPMLKQQMLSGEWAHVVNGWRYPPPQMGRFGDDFGAWFALSQIEPAASAAEAMLGPD